jgi:hypothetical protein
MKSSFDILLEAIERGLTISVRGDRLAVKPDSALTRDFAGMLRAHKPELLQLLNLPFLIVQSEVLNDIVVFASDDQTKQKLVAAGAVLGSIYTRSELAVLVERQVSADELRKLHQAKRGFHGTIAP